jgi:phosphonate transport system substrate-binding protein
MRRFAATIFFLLLTIPASAQTWSFGMSPFRSPLLTAQYWNPILDYVASKSGVKLELVTTRTGQEASDEGARGKFDFIWDNHIFEPTHAAAAYKVLARPAGDPIKGQIIVAENSALKTLRDLQGQEMGVSSKAAFVGYAVTMGELYRQGISVKPVVAGTMEGVMAQVRAGELPVGSVNSKVLSSYAAREGFKYRTLWLSEPYLDVPIAAHPRVPTAVVKAVRVALAGMAQDPEGLKILKATAALIKEQPPYGFVAADDAEYENQREVYRLIWKKEGR